MSSAEPRPQDGTLPGWIVDPALAPVWRQIRRRFERAGLVATGSVDVVLATRGERHAAGGLLGRTVTRGRVRVDLAALDARLRDRSGVGGLHEVLPAMDGVPLRDRREERAELDEARQRPLALADELVATEWSIDWIAGLRRTGLLTGRPDAERVVRDAAAVLLHLTETPATPRSRVEVGALLLGDAHALDRDRLLHGVVLRGLAAATGVAVPEGAYERERLWAAYGVEPDLLSRTCLVWRLPVHGDSPTARRVNDAAAAGDPVHLTEWDLRRADPCAPGSGSRVLVCENPRVIEAVAEQRVDGWAAVCTAGEPNLVVDRVLRGLASAGADLRYHGDFDWPGIALANRAVARYVVKPLLMAAGDYVAAVRSDGPVLAGAPVEPLWDAELGAAMRSHKRAIHEEAVLGSLLASLASLDPPQG